MATTNPRASVQIVWDKQGKLHTCSSGSDDILEDPLPEVVLPQVLADFLDPNNSIFTDVLDLTKSRYELAGNHPGPRRRVIARLKPEYGLLVEAGCSCEGPRTDSDRRQGSLAMEGQSWGAKNSYLRTLGGKQLNNHLTTVSTNDMAPSSTVVVRRSK